MFSRFYDTANSFYSGLEVKKIKINEKTIKREFKSMQIYKNHDSAK